MICPKCKGSRMVFKRIENTVMLGYCPMCNGVGKIKGTNFQRITESPEALAEFIDKIICHCSDHDKDCTECPMRENRNCDYETTLEWLNQEGEE